MKCSKVKLCFFLSLFVNLQFSWALNCYQCKGSDSSEPFQCNEYLSNDIDIEPESCDNVYDAKYCVKHIGRFEGGIGAKRFCSSLHLGNYCSYVKQPGDILSYRTCIFTCTGDGCNSSSSIKPHLIVYLIIGCLTLRLSNLIIR